MSLRVLWQLQVHEAMLLDRKRAQVVEETPGLQLGKLLLAIVRPQGETRAALVQGNPPRTRAQNRALVR